jgi:4-amino-4-deoxy-L-arabinose transferase-like glycosyltransferase
MPNGIARRPGSLPYFQERWVMVILGLIVAFALSYRLLNLTFGLPSVSHEEFSTLGRVWDMNQSGDLNPHWFRWPSLLFYLELPLLKLPGVVEWSSFVVAARVLQAVLGAAMVAVVYFLTAALFRKETGLVAAFLVAILPPAVFFSHIARPEVLTALFYLLTFLFSIYMVKTGRLRFYILAAVCVGLATSAKYNGAFSALILLAAHLLAVRYNQQTRVSLTQVRRWLIIIGLPVAVFFLTSPYTLLDFATFWQDLMYQGGRAGVSLLTSFSDAGNLLLTEMGALLLALCALGLIYAARKHRPLDILCLVALFSAVLLVFVWDPSSRLLLPAMTILIVLGAGLAEKGWELAGKRWGHRAGMAILLVIVGLVSFMPLQLDQSRSAELSKPSVTEAVTAWLEKNAPAGSHIYWGYNAPVPYVTQGGKMLYVTAGATEPHLMYDSDYNLFQEAGYNFVILTDQHRADLNSKNKKSKEYIFYNQLYDQATVQEFAWGYGAKYKYAASNPQAILSTFESKGIIYILELKPTAR